MFTRSKNSRAPWKQVAYVRHSTDPSAPLAAGASYGEGRIITMTVTTKDGGKYEIPVNSEGKVPMRYLYARLLDEKNGSRSGKRRRAGVDLKSDSKVVHPYPAGGFTPKEVVETGWWQYPNECDLEGVDDKYTSAPMMARLDGYSKGVQGAGRKIVFLMPKDSTERAWKILNDDFTATELRKAVKGGGLIIQEIPLGRTTAGRYQGIMHGSSIRAPVIELGPGWNEDDLVHEFTHHLRLVDDTRTGLTRTALKVNADNERMHYYWDEQHEMHSAYNLEEAATVAEAATRTRMWCGPAGYYASTSVHGNDPFARYDHDRKLLAGDGPKKGRTAEKRLKERFPDTSISHMNYYNPGVSAIHRYEQTFPDEARAARKPAKAKSKNARARYYGRYRAHYER